MAHSSLSAILGDPVMDPGEDAFIIFSQDIPSQSLGFVDSKAPAVQLTVAGRDLTIHQSRSLLTSDRKEGTTGAVLWKVSPLFAEWIASPSNFLFQHKYLGPSSNAVELGAGVSGIVALTLGPQIHRYVATDQSYVMRLLEQNIAENLGSVFPNETKNNKSKRKQSTRATNEDISRRITAYELDWELDDVSLLPTVLDLSESDGEGVDLVVACDCIYNDSLIEPLNAMCADICNLRADHGIGNPTICLIAQQLRAPDVFESWLKSFHRLFHVWQVPNELLTDGLKENSGFVVHVGILREDSLDSDF